MKYHTFYIVLICATAPAHLFAGKSLGTEEAHTAELKEEEKRIQMFTGLFNKTNTYPMYSFVITFFKGAFICTNNENLCAFYWDPSKKFYWDPQNETLDVKSAVKLTSDSPLYLYIKPYKDGFDVYWNDNDKMTEALSQKVKEYQPDAERASVKLTLDPDGNREMILAITPISDEEVTC